MLKICGFTQQYVLAFIKVVEENVHNLCYAVMLIRQKNFPLSLPVPIVIAADFTHSNLR